MEKNFHKAHHKFDVKSEKLHKFADPTQTRKSSPFAFT